MVRSLQRLIPNSKLEIRKETRDRVERWVLRGNPSSLDTRHSSTLLLRQPVKQVHGLNRLAGFAEGPEPAFVDGHNTTRAVESSHCAVNGEPKRRIVAPHHQSIGFVGEYDIRQGEASRIFRR